MIFTLLLLSMVSFADGINSEAMQASTLRVINDYRDSLGLAKVVLNHELQSFEDQLIASNIKAHRTMLKNAAIAGENLAQLMLPVSHNTEDGTYAERVENLEQKFDFTGEVITCGTNVMTPDDALSAFLKSPKHKKIIEDLRPNQVSVSVSHDDTRYGCGYYWAWFFHLKVKEKI